MSDENILPGPDFIGIGTMRAGTTWLSKVMELHPEIWKSPQKEMHWFDRSPKYESSELYNEFSRVKRLLGSGRFSRKWRKTLVDSLKRSLRAGSAGPARLFFRKLSLRTDQDYLDWFAPKGSRKGFEITPTYFFLDESDIRGIRETLPHARFFAILRDPVERSWSHYRFSLKHHTGDLSEFPKADDETAMIAFFNESGLRRRNDYCENLHRWRRVVGKERLLVMFYDEIAQTPDMLIDRLTDFLGIRKFDDNLRASVGELGRINRSPSSSMPHNLRRYLINQYKPMVLDLAKEFPKICNEWLDRYERSSL